MTSLTLSIAMQMVLLGAAPEEAASYSKAHEATTKTGQPLVVLVGAKWCPACVEMKESVLPQLIKRGSLKSVSFAEVDLDRQQELGRQLTKGGPIPQLLMYRRTNLGWRLRRIIGGQSIETADRFIAEGVALDKAAKRNGATPNRAQESKGVASRSTSDGRS